MVDLSTGFDFYSRLIKVSTLRSRVIAHNVANQNTPEFKRREVSFEDDLRDAIHSKGGRDVWSVEPSIKAAMGGNVKPNGNNVTFEDEYALSIKNQMVFNVVNEALKWRFKIHNEALNLR